MRILLILCVLGVAFPALAQNVSPEFQAEFQKGLDAYRLGKYDEAEQHFEAAKKIDRTLPGPWRYLGAVAKAESRFDDCVASTREAIRLNPQSGQVADTRKLHDECRAALGKPAFDGTYGPSEGALSVTTDQVGATVTVNGLRYGSTPLLRLFPVGDAEVLVEKIGFLPQTRKISVLPELVTDVDFVLEKDPNAGGELVTPVEELKHGWLVVETTTPAAEIVIDGKTLALDADGRYQVDEGRHEVLVRAPAHEPQVRRVRVTRGQLVRVKVDLRAQATVARNRTVGRVAIGAGLGLAAVGAVTGILSMRASDEARDWWVIETTRPTTNVEETYAVEPLHTREDIEAKVDDAERMALISNLSYGAAVVAIGVGAYFLVKGRPAGDAPTVMVAPVPGGAAAVGEVRW